MNEQESEAGGEGREAGEPCADEDGVETSPIPERSSDGEGGGAHGVFGLSSRITRKGP